MAKDVVYYVPERLERCKENIESAARKDPCNTIKLLKLLMFGLQISIHNVSAIKIIRKNFFCSYLVLLVKCDHLVIYYV